MRRIAVAGGAIAAHKVAAPSPSGLGVASNGSMNPDVQLPAPNGSLGHTRGQANCVTARWKALTNAVMHVHVAWNDTPHNSDGTAEAVGSHNVSNTKHFSVEDGAKTEIRVGPGALTADLERAGCAVILRYRSAELLSGFTRYITFNSAADLSLSWCLYRTVPPPLPPPQPPLL